MFIDVRDIFCDEIVVFDMGKIMGFDTDGDDFVAHLKCVLWVITIIAGFCIITTGLLKFSSLVEKVGKVVVTGANDFFIGLLFIIFEFVTESFELFRGPEVVATDPGMVKRHVGKETVGLEMDLFVE